MNVAIYARLSDDRGGQATGVDRQLEACRQYAKSQGWTIAAEFSDTDLSAFRKGVVRPGYEEMISRLDEFDAVLVWKLDRLVRRFLEFARVWPMFASQGTSLVSATEPIDTSSAVGRIIVLMLVGFAELESENISIRQRSKHAELRRLGRPSGGGRRPFGYNPDESINEHEAEIIREVARRLIAGESTTGICVDLTRRGVKTSEGGPFMPHRLKRIMLSPRLAGRREGQVVENGSIPAILPLETFEAVKAVLETRSVGYSKDTAGRKYWLSGFLHCAICGRRLDTKSKKNRQSYDCESRMGGCGRVSISRTSVEGVVEAELLKLLERSPIHSFTAPVNNDLPVKIRADEAALAELTRVRFVERLISDEEYRGARSELVERIEANKKRMAPRTRIPEIKGKAREAWASADLHRRRAILGVVVDRILIHPAAHRGRFDPARVEPIFRA